MSISARQPSSLLHKQRGITTLLIAILLLAILSIVVLFATSVGVFDQRTATNENRAKLAQASAEAGLGLAAEFLKANIARVSSTEANGWLNAGSMRWVPCSTAVPAGQVDPCLAERDTVRRAAMYRYVFNGTTNMDYQAVLPNDARLAEVSLGNAGTPMTVTVSAALCRFDMTDPDNPFCSLTPEDEDNRIAVTMVSNADIPGEAARAEIKETLATFRVIGGAATVPLVASGTVMGLGNATIVANPNAGGFGVPASIWSPCPVDIEAGSTGAPDPFNLCPAAASSGIGSVITCHLGEYLQGRPRTDLLTVCPFTANACDCPGIADGALSGKSGSLRREGIDILDRDGGVGLPDITYFPRAPYDDPADPLDDSLFEVIFAQDVVAQGTVNVRTNCSGPSVYGGDCAKIALHSLNPVKTTCGALNAASSGLYWVMEGDCGAFPAQVGTPQEPVVLVIEGAEGTIQPTGNMNFFGMLFIRSSTNKATFAPRGNVSIFGMAVVEGMADPKGNFELVYSDEIATRINSSPAFTRFGRLPGSWLDARSGF